jgi:multiple sugar transport system substrate-binding protein
MLRRRQVLATGIAAGTLTAPLVARGQAGFNWRRFSGQTLEVAMQRTVFCDVLQQYEHEFTDLTGIKVNSEQVPEQQFRQKLVMEFASGTPGIDVCYLAYTSQKRLFARGKWLIDLRPFIANPNLTPADFDLADFTKPSIDYATQDDGRLDTLPITFAYNIVMWNKELFAARSIAPPQTYAELLAAARQLHDPKNGISGFVGRGLKAANVILWTGFLLGYGLDAIDVSGKINTDGPESIASAQLYQTLLRDYGPPGVIGFNWNECLTTFMLGRAAMFLDTTTVGQPVGDPTRSRIAGKVGYALMPAGPKTRCAPMFGDGFGVASASQRKEAAWLYCQWATGKVNQARQLIGGYGGSVRKSAYAAVATASNVKAPREWLRVVEQSGPIARPGLPQIVAVGQFRDTFGTALTNMLGGSDAAAELRRATAEFRPILAQTEKT